VETVSKPHQNSICCDGGCCQLSERQTPQVVEKPENTIETLELKEAHRRLHTQEVTGSSPVAPTIHFREIRPEEELGEWPSRRIFRRCPTWSTVLNIRADADETPTNWEASADYEVQ
jgi:hypothetical protein